MRKKTITTGTKRGANFTYIKAWVGGKFRAFEKLLLEVWKEFGQVEHLGCDGGIMFL